jgi:hypothetical protein
MIAQKFRGKRIRKVSNNNHHENKVWIASTFILCFSIFPELLKLAYSFLGFLLPLFKNNLFHLTE